MLTNINDLRSMNRELAERCLTSGLDFECGAGGNFNATVAVVAEAPGEREVFMKTPLVGNSGKLLWDCLRREKLTRNDVYVTNVSKRQNLQLAGAFQASNAKKPAMSKHDLGVWRQLLLAELATLPNLQYIIALGGVALEALTNETGILNWRGSVVDVRIGQRTIPVVCTINPAAALREPRLELPFKFDLHKLTRVRSGTFKRPNIRTHINPTFKQALDYIELCRNQKEAVAYDIESLAGYTACVGLAHSNTEAMCINWRTENQSAFSVHQELVLRMRLQRLFAGHLRLVAQNANFDMSWLWYRDRICVHKTWMDTMLAHHCLYPTLPHGLGFLTAQYTDHPYYKDDGHDWQEVGDIDMFWRYNGTDCCITRAASETLLVELEQAKLDTFFFNHIMRLQPHLVGMTVMGVKADLQVKEQINDTLRDSLVTAKEVCNAKAAASLGIPSYEFNPASPKQLGKLLFNELRLVGRGTSTDKENRARIKQHPRTSNECRELIDAIDIYLRDAKFRSTFSNAKTGIDGRFRCEYRQTGVAEAPGRLSSAQTLWGEGLNLQTIPEKAKVMFVADEGYEFNYFDKAQIEARFVGWMANISTWQEQFERARLNPGAYDAHKALASEMYGIPYDELSSEDWEPDDLRGGLRLSPRGKAKRCRHGLNYRMGPDRLATTAKLPISEAEASYRLYHRSTPEIKQWWADTVDDARRNRCLYSPLGRRWILLERWNDDAVDSIIAFRPQSTAGDAVAGCIYLCHEDPEWPKDARIVLNVHDALVALNRIGDGATVRRIMKHHSEQPIYIPRYVDQVVPDPDNPRRTKTIRVLGDPKPCIVPSDFKVSYPDEHGVHRWSTLGKVK